MFLTHLDKATVLQNVVHCCLAGYWGAIATGDTPRRYRGARTFGWGPIRGVPD